MVGNVPFTLELTVQTLSSRMKFSLYTVKTLRKYLLGNYFTWWGITTHDLRLNQERPEVLDLRLLDGSIQYRCIVLNVRFFFLLSLESRPLTNSVWDLTFNMCRMIHELC